MLALEQGGVFIVLYLSWRDLGLHGLTRRTATFSPPLRQVRGTEDLVVFHRDTRGIGISANRIMQWIKATMDNLLGY